MTIQDIPIGVLDHVGWALGVLRQAHDQIMTMRQLEAALGQPGRYEAELRHGPNYPNVAAAKKALAKFEQLAAPKGINPQNVYAELGGYVAPPEWSAEALAWLRP